MPLLLPNLSAPTTLSGGVKDRATSAAVRALETWAVGLTRRLAALDVTAGSSSVVGGVGSVTAGSSAVSVSPTTGAVVVDVVESNFNGIPQAAVTNLTSDLATINADITAIEGDIVTINTTLAGKIDEVIAGTNLSGGGTSGSVTLNVVDSPSFAGKVTASLGTSGAAAADVDTALELEKDTDVWLTIRAPSANRKGIKFTNPSGTSDGAITYDGPSFTRGLQFNTAGSTRFQISSSGASTFLGSLTANTTLSVLGNATLGNASTDAHSLTGTLNLNATAGSNGQVAQIVGGLPVWSDVTVAEVTGLQTELDGKSDVGHTHVQADITDFTHTHAIADVTGLQTALDGKSDVGHGHAISDVTGLQTALDGKAAVVHGHTISDVTGLQTALDGKSDDGHTHTKSEITDFAHTHVKTDITDFAHTHVKADVTDFAHTHPQSDITNLVSDLAGKAPTTRTISTTAPLAGGGDLSANRTLSISADGISNTLLRNSVGCSVIGRSANTTGDPADIQASSDNTVLRRVGGVLGFGTIPTSAVTNISGTTGKLAKFTASNTIGDSIASESASVITVSGGLVVTGSTVLGDASNDIVTITGQVAATYDAAGLTSGGTAHVFSNTSDYNTTTSPLTAQALKAEAVVTHPDEQNTLTNRAFFATATCADDNTVNQAIYTQDGDCEFNVASGTSRFHQDVEVSGDLSSDGSTTLGTDSSDAHVINGTVTIQNLPSLSGPLQVGASQAYIYLGRQVFTDGGTYTPTPGTRGVFIRLVGQGGGGGGATGTGSGVAVGAGGSSGVYIEKWIASGGIAGTVITGGPVTVYGPEDLFGLGGTGTSSGGNGGLSKVEINGVEYTAPGGTGGGGSARATTTFLRAGGAVDTTGISAYDAVSGNHGEHSVYVPGSHYCAGAGGSNPLGLGGAGSTSFSSDTDGFDGQGYGSGGGGAVSALVATTRTGGDGGRGCVIIEEYA